MRCGRPGPFPRCPGRAAPPDAAGTRNQPGAAVASAGAAALGGSAGAAAAGGSGSTGAGGVVFVAPVAGVEAVFFAAVFVEAVDGFGVAFSTGAAADAFGAAVAGAALTARGAGAAGAASRTTTVRSCTTLRT